MPPKQKPKPKQTRNSPQISITLRPEVRDKLERIKEEQALGSLSATISWLAWKHPVGQVVE